MSVLRSVPGTYAATALVAALLLTPHIGNFAVAAYVLGPLAGVWVDTRIRHRDLTLTQGATLGFSAGFYGMILALAIDQIAFRITHDHLWRSENWYELLPLIAGKGLDTNTPGDWYGLMALLTIGAIFAGMLGAPAGMLGVKLFARKGNVA